MKISWSIVLITCAVILCVFAGGIRFEIPADVREWANTALFAGTFVAASSAVGLTLRTRTLQVMEQKRHCAMLAQRILNILEDIEVYPNDRWEFSYQQLIGDMRFYIFLARASKLLIEAEAIDRFCVSVEAYFGLCTGHPHWTQEGEGEDTHETYAALIRALGLNSETDFTNFKSRGIRVIHFANPATKV